MVKGSIWKKKVELDKGLNPMAARGQPSVAHCGASKPKRAFLGDNTHHKGGLFAAVWLPMGFYVLPLSSDDHPSFAQGSLGLSRVIRNSSFFSEPMKVIFS